MTTPPAFGALVGVTPVEFRGDLWRQQTRVPGLSCGVVCVMLRLAVLVELRLMTDGHGHRQTQAHGIATRCKKSTKTAATMAAIFDSNMQQIVYRLEIRPRPTGEGEGVRPLPYEEKKKSAHMLIAIACRSCAATQHPF